MLIFLLADCWETSAPGALVEPGLAAGLGLSPAQAGEEEAAAPGEVLESSVVHSHWSRNVEAWLSLVESVAGASSAARASLERKIGGILLAPRWFFMA